MIQSSISKLTLNRFVNDVFVVTLDGAQATFDFESPLVEQAAARCLATAQAVVLSASSDEDNPESSSIESVLALPVFDAKTMTSIALMTVKDRSLPGVFEVWRSIGKYQELGLDSGYFGQLERFQNVSSFVRFEYGSGLPGLAWRTEKTVIHDNLANHPGFLRAAGASAEALSTAIGVPVFNDEFDSTVVLISSNRSPLAKAIEVWELNGSDLVLNSSAYSEGAESELAILRGNSISEDHGLIHSAKNQRQAVLTDDLEACRFGRSLESLTSQGVCGGLAIPTFVETELKCVTSFLFYDLSEQHECC